MLSHALSACNYLLPLFHLITLSFIFIPFPLSINNSDQAPFTYWSEIGDWRDTMPALTGSVKVRYTNSDFGGNIMVHCHFLPHEDMGMMDRFWIEPAVTEGTSTAPRVGIASALVTFISGGSRRATHKSRSICNFTQYSARRPAQLVQQSVRWQTARMRLPRSMTNIQKCLARALLLLM
jgi:hypothetical protein